MTETRITQYVNCDEPYELTEYPKRRLLTTRFVIVTTPKHIEYRIVDVYRNKLFKILDAAINPWRAEKEIFYNGKNRTIIKYKGTQETPFQRTKRIQEVKELYKSPRLTDEHFKIISYL